MLSPRGLAQHVCQPLRFSAKAPPKNMFKVVHGGEGKGRRPTSKNKLLSCLVGLRCSPGANQVHTIPGEGEAATGPWGW